MRNAKVRVFMPAAWFLACAVVAAADRPQPMIGEAAPAFNLAGLDGKRAALADIRGKLVVLHFGAGW